MKKGSESDTTTYIEAVRAILQQMQLDEDGSGTLRLTPKQMDALRDLADVNYASRAVEALLARVSTRSRIDVEGECNAKMFTVDDFAKNTRTARCSLESGHEGLHTERFRHYGASERNVTITWEKDERK